jgi:short-subunit dehydrogenase
MTTHDDRPVWLVTGCSTGMGRALVETLAANDYRVMATARNVSDIEALAEGRAGQVAVHSLDLVDASTIDDAVAATIETFGGVDILCSCASTGLVGSVEESSIEEMQNLFEVNYIGTLRVVKAVLPHMRERGSGHIAVLTSKGAFQGQPGVAGYCASKAALNAMLEALAVEMKPLGVGVTIVEPGLVVSNFHVKASVSTQERIAAYDETAGATRAYIAAPYPPDASDPHTAARAIMLGLTAPEPPLNLPLGADAIAMIRGKFAAVNADIEAFGQLSLEVKPVPA